MKLDQMSCVACGAPVEVPADASQIQCKYCGAFMEVQRSPDRQHIFLVKTISEAVEKAQSKTQQAVRMGTELTQTELKRIQLNQEISALRLELANVQGEIRALERDRKTRRSKQQLKELKTHEQQLTAEAERGWVLAPGGL